MSGNSEFIEVRQIIERYKGDFGWQTQVKTVIEDQSEDLSEEFLDDLYNDYGIEVPDSKSTTPL